MLKMPNYPTIFQGPLGEYVLGNCTGCLTAGVAGETCNNCAKQKYRVIKMEGLYINAIDLARINHMQVVHPTDPKQYTDPSKQQFEEVAYEEFEFDAIVEQAQVRNDRERNVARAQEKEEEEEEEEELVCSYSRHHDEYWITTCMNGPRKGDSKMFRLGNCSKCCTAGQIGIKCHHCGEDVYRILLDKDRKPHEAQSLARSNNMESYFPRFEDIELTIEM